MPLQEGHAEGAEDAPLRFATSAIRRSATRGGGRRPRSSLTDRDCPRLAGAGCRLAGESDLPGAVAGRPPSSMAPLAMNPGPADQGPADGKGGVSSPGIGGAVPLIVSLTPQTWLATGQTPLSGCIRLRGIPKSMARSRPRPSWRRRRETSHPASFCVPGMVVGPCIMDAPDALRSRRAPRALAAIADRKSSHRSLSCLALTEVLGA